MRQRHHHNQPIAAAQAGMSDRTARRQHKRGGIPSQTRPTRGRTVDDPLEAVWNAEIVPMLERDPSLRPFTLLQYLEGTYPEEFAGGSVRRTLERRVRGWKGLHGPARDVIFRQTPEPGRMALSDFTDAGDLGVTIAGEAFPHLLYNFVLAYSGWQHVGVVTRGESFTALAENLQNALWSLGGVPTEHRTDSLSAAFRNLDARQEADVTERYEDLCRHYGLKASRNNRGEAHENGAVEAHNGHLKEALDQALMLRGDRDFPTLAAYRAFIDDLVGRRNLARKDALKVELDHLRSLPARRTTDFEETVVTVLGTSGFWLKKVFYTVPSRLIGHRLRVHVHDARIEIYLGHTHVATHPRKPRPADGRRDHVIDYHHLIHSLKRKPGALTELTYRDALFPRVEYRRAWEVLDAALPRQDACKRTVGLLALAHEEACEGALARLIQADIDAGRLPDPEVLRPHLRPAQEAPRDVPVTLTAPARFDDLLGRGGEAVQ